MAGKRRFAVEAFLPAFVVREGQCRTKSSREVVAQNLSRGFLKQNCADDATKFRDAASDGMQNTLRMQRLNQSY